MNEQKIVEIRGERATKTSYCQVGLIGTMDRQRPRTTRGFIHNDEHVPGRPVAGRPPGVEHLLARR